MLSVLERSHVLRVISDDQFGASRVDELGLHPLVKLRNDIHPLRKFANHLFFLHGHDRLFVSICNFYVFDFLHSGRVLKVLLTTGLLD